MRKISAVLEYFASRIILYLRESMLSQPLPETRISGLVQLFSEAEAVATAKSHPPSNPSYGVLPTLHPKSRER